MLEFLIIMVFLLPFLMVYGVYKFLISDFFVEKTGFHTFCKVDDKKRCTDIVYVVFGFLMNCAVLTTGYLLDFIFGGIIFQVCIVLCLCWFYVLIGIFLRLKYYFFIDEERHPCKREYKIDYVDRGIRWGLLFSISLTLYVVLFLLFPKHVDLLVIFVWFILLNGAIFPDYLNRIWKEDVRTREGNDKILGVYSLIGLISMYVVLFIK